MSGEVCTDASVPSVVSSLEKQKAPAWAASALVYHIPSQRQEGSLQDGGLGVSGTREATSPAWALSTIRHFLIGTREGLGTVLKFD